MANRIKKRPKPAPFAIAPNKLSALKLVFDGAQSLSQGAHERAESLWREAVFIDPQCTPAWTYLVDFLTASKRMVEAVFCLERLISVSEKTPENLYMLADKSCFLKQYQAGRRLLNEALDLKPEKKTWIDLTVLLAKLDFNDKDWEASIKNANLVLDTDPDHCDALEVRQRSHFRLAWAEEDVADCRRFLQLKPDVKIHSFLLFKLSHLAATTSELIYQESLHWSELYAEPFAAEILPHTNVPDPQRRLKIGYLSSDFREHHPIMKLVPGVFENHDRNKFEVFVYSIDTVKNPAAEYVLGVVDHFIPVRNDTREIANRVRADGIDLFVDLAGHTMPVHAHLSFALKPAPVQVSWMGLLLTTGFKTMDYFIGDQHVPAPGTEHLFTEKIYRMPRVHSCYRPPADPGIVAPPYFKNGYITFGCFNDPIKITRSFLKVWSVLMHLFPDSKMLLKYANLDRAMGQKRLRQWFMEDGIAADRLQFEAFSNTAFDYFKSWNKVDIALDPFPYNGGTTTMDALWMGVPVVSMGGRLTVSAISASLLSEVGLPVAATAEQYIALATQWVSAIREGPQIRQRLRETMIQSRMMDEKGLTRTLETAYREMWRAWCHQGEDSGTMKSLGKDAQSAEPRCQIGL